MGESRKSAAEPDENKLPARGFLFLIFSLTLFALCLITVVVLAVLGPPKKQPPTGTATITTAAILPAATGLPPRTSTPWPTGTPTPTSTAQVFAGRVKAAVAFCQMRAGPGGNFPSLQRLAAGSAVLIAGRSQDGAWYQVITREESRGWVSRNFIEIGTAATDMPVSVSIFPTYTSIPQATRTASPTSGLSERPPKGTYCGQDAVLQVCTGSFEYKDTFGSRAALAQSRFIALTASFQNLSDTSLLVNPFDMTLVMEGGGTYIYSQVTYYATQPLRSATVEPGKNISGTIVFDVPRDTWPVKVIYKKSLYQTEIEIELD